MRNKNILLIEDNVLHLRLIEKLVEHISHRLIAVSTLQEGIKQLKLQKFDVILLDLTLPDSSGGQTFMEIMQHNRDVPVILITGREDEQLALELIREGAQDYIVKQDLTRDFIEKTISYSIERFALLRDIREQRDKTLLAEMELKRLNDELYQSNEFLQRSMMESPLGIRIVSEQGELIYANQAMLDIYGYESFQELQNTPVTERYTPESYAAFKERKMKRKKGEWKSPQKYEISIVRKDGEIRHLLVYRTELFWNGKKHHQVQYIDHTERINAAIAIREKNEMLRNMNTAKDNFFSILAHDLKGPLSTFVAATQLLSDEIGEMSADEIREMTGSLRDSAGNIYKLLENLLNWAQLERGGIKFSPEWIRLEHLLKTCSGTLVDAAHRKNIDLVMSIHDELEIFADRNMLQTILRNIVSNAVKYTPQGGQVEVSAQALQDHSVIIRVADSGIGIPQEDLKKLFLFSGIAARRGTGGEVGTGLGLVISKEFVERHKGTIRVESEVGKGSIFHLTFPGSGQNKQG